DADHQVSYGMKDVTKAQGRADGTTVTYPSVQSNVDLKVESQPGGVKETLVLASPDSPRTFTFPLHLKGLTANLVNDQIVFVDDKGARRAVIPAGVMTDAHNAVSNGVRYQLDQDILTVTVDDTWLRDPNRAFPVDVDPTVQLPVNGGAADSSLSVSGGS